MAPLEFRTIPVDNSSDIGTVLAVAGEIDVATAPQLRDHLDTVPGRHTVLDLSDVSLLSAAGLAALLDLQDRLHRADARLALAALSPAARRVLIAAGLDTTLAAAPSVTHAVALITTGTLTLPAPPAALQGRRRTSTHRLDRRLSRRPRPQPRTHAAAQALDGSATPTRPRGCSVQEVPGDDPDL